MRSLLSTTCSYTAGLLGYDGPMDPREDGYGFELSVDGDGFSLVGPDGEVRLDPSEAKMIAEEILRQVGFAERRAA